MAHHLPSLAGLSLGPPTGPMARYGKEVFEPPSDGKRQRGEGGLTVNISRWEPEDGSPIDPITQQPFIPGQWVYKTPTDVPGQPHYETPTNYDPWMLEQYWAHQTPTWLSSPPGAPLQKYVKDPLGAVIPYAEYEALAQWVNDPNNKKPESPPSTPFDLADYVHKPPAGAREPPPQSPVDPMEGRLFEGGFPSRMFPRLPTYVNPGQTYGVEASIIADSDAPDDVKKYADDYRGWHLRYFNPTVGNGFRIQHERNEVTATLMLDLQSVLAKRLLSLVKIVNGRQRIVLPLVDTIEDMMLGDLFLREFIRAFDGSEERLASDTFAKFTLQDEDEWKGLKSLFQVADYDLDWEYFEYYPRQFEIRLIVSNRMWSALSDMQSEQRRGRTALERYFHANLRGTGNAWGPWIHFNAPPNQFWNISTDYGDLRADGRGIGTEGFTAVCTHLIKTVYNAISVVLQGDHEGWPLNGRTWRESEPYGFFPRLPADHPRRSGEGFFAVRKEGGPIQDMDDLCLDILDMDSVTFFEERHRPDNAVHAIYASLPIWYAVHKDKRGWLPALGSEEWRERHGKDGLLAPVAWLGTSGEAPPPRFTVPGTEEDVDDFPGWMSGFVEHVAREYPWMDWTYFVPFKGKLQLQHEERGRMLLPEEDAGAQTPRGITRAMFSVLPSSALAHAIEGALTLTLSSNFVTEQGLGGMSFREFFLYCMFNRELDVDVLQAKRDIEAGYPTAFGAAVHPHDFTVHFQRQSDGTWNFQIEVSDALLSYAAVIEYESGETFWRSYRTAVVDDDVSTFFFNPVVNHGFPFDGYVFNRFSPANRRVDNAMTLDPQGHIRRGYGRMIGCVAEAVSAMLCIGVDGSRQEKALFSDNTDGDEVRKGGFLACFPHEDFARAALLRGLPEAHARVLAAQAFASDMVREDAEKGRMYFASMPFWFCTCPLNKPEHYAPPPVANAS